MNNKQMTDIFIEQTFTDKNGYPYTTLTNDENRVRIYTLKNGLKVYLAQNFDAPKIQTYIPVRTGSNNDPSDNTGLAHYLEHMMFKGTSKIGTSDWAREKQLLDQISELFEHHKSEQDPDRKKEIYQKIDTLSQEASRFAIANEYDKCISSLGATGTNAHTWFDETVYKNNIPNNELEKWLKIESERFSEVVLRLFHTELESVYEEFNRAQDNDARLVQYALMELLFPKHPNGQQTTLGKSEHLKNPSMKAIHQYFDEYYVPNNYAVVLVGDLQFDETIQLVDEYFGKFEFRELPTKTKISEEPITEILTTTVKSPTIPRVQIAWRTDSYGSDEWLMADIVANILSNKGEAGLLDLHINNAQKALYATAFNMGLNEYGYISAVIVPKEDQTLDEGVAMLLEEIEKIKAGEFPDWMLPAIVNDFKLQRLKGLETADGLATNLYQTFIRRQTWKDELDEMARFAAVKKEDVVKFANHFFKDHYVAVYKEKGENEDLIRVENPGITPVKLNREEKSAFLKEILAKKSADIKPEFIDYQKEISESQVKGKKLSFVKNQYNAIAQVHFIFPFGSDHDKELGLATQVLQYLGTDRFSAEELKQEFYKIGVTNDFKTAPDQLIVSLTGLEDQLGNGIELLHHWLERCVADQGVYQQFVQTILESREAAKKDRARVMQALQHYAKFGENSRFRDVVSKERLESIDCQELTDKMKALFGYPYEIFFYGTDAEQFKTHLKPYIKPETNIIPAKKSYPEPETEQNVYFVNYDMVQMEMSRVAKGQPVKTEHFGKINVFNEYFGSGLSSIVFQEIRESKSLAYSAYVAYQANPELEHPDYVTAYIGTQPDKLDIAVQTMQDLMNELPQVDIQFNNSKAAALKQLASGRITRTNIFFNHLRLKKLGIDYDLRKDMYAEIQRLDFTDLKAFYNEKIKPLKFNTAVLGKRENLDMEAIATLGTFRELTAEELFNF